MYVVFSSLILASSELETKSRGRHLRQGPHAIKFEIHLDQKGYRVMEHKTRPKRQINETRKSESIQLIRRQLNKFSKLKPQEYITGGQFQSQMCMWSLSMNDTGWFPRHPSRCCPAHAISRGQHLNWPGLIGYRWLLHGIAAMAWNNQYRRDCFLAGCLCN